MPLEFASSSATCSWMENDLGASDACCTLPIAQLSHRCIVNLKLLS